MYRELAEVRFNRRWLLLPEQPGQCDLEFSQFDLVFVSGPSQLSC